MDWIYLFQGRDQWKALLNMVMNFRFKKMLGNSSVAERLATSQEGFSAMKLDGWINGWIDR
jgi:hypothetical protein